jgi:hypothetical protein
MRMMEQSRRKTVVTRLMKKKRPQPMTLMPQKLKQRTPKQKMLRQMTLMQRKQQQSMTLQPKMPARIQKMTEQCWTCWTDLRPFEICLAERTVMPMKTRNLMMLKKQHLTVRLKMGRRSAILREVRMQWSIPR